MFQVKVPIIFRHTGFFATQGRTLFSILPKLSQIKSLVISNKESHTGQILRLNSNNKQMRIMCLACFFRELVRKFSDQNLNVAHPCYISFQICKTEASSLIYF